ncbi:MAG: glutamine-hydrolyzing GMP synthase [Fibrobacterota bacterium]
MEKIAVIDFGGQYAHLIASKIRRLNVYSEIISPGTPLQDVRGCSGLVYSGGPSSVYSPDRPVFNPELLDFEGPQLGLCYGHQLIADTLGGEVLPGDTGEYGLAAIEIKSADGIFKGLSHRQTVWMSHGDSVKKPAPGFKVSAVSDDCPVAAVENPERRIYGFQFHPEVTHTENGTKMLSNFLDICGCSGEWTMENFIESVSSEIKKQASGKKVMLLVSGGVDSTVTFALLNEVLGPERVFGLHIDTGMMRLDETGLIKEYMNAHGFKNLQITDASGKFLKALEGVCAPEEKRAVIGEMFIKIQREVLTGMVDDDSDWLLAQGTIYPDTIESGGTENSKVIKTHHNRVPIIEKLISEGKVIEPLRYLYKDGVRQLGEKLGLPHELVWRHPFPGPGLGVRLLCRAEGTEDEDLPGLPSELATYLESLGLEGSPLPVKSVGVQGDNRTYRHPYWVRGSFDWEVLDDVSTRITNRCDAFNRVVLLITDVEGVPFFKPVPGYMTEKRLDILRQADDIVTRRLEENGLMEEFAQVPVIMLPLKFEEKETVVIRPLNTSDFMTGRFGRMDKELLKKISDEITDKTDVGAVFYDITNKPPGTTEWE